MHIKLKYIFQDLNLNKLTPYRDLDLNIQWSKFWFLNILKGKAIESKHNESVQDFYKIKEKCLKEGILFEDPEFPPKDSSLYFTSSRTQPKVVWKRPKVFWDLQLSIWIVLKIFCRFQEMSANPKFFSDGASRFDVQQGELGKLGYP